MIEKISGTTLLELRDKDIQTQIYLNKNLAIRLSMKEKSPNAFLAFLENPEVWNPTGVDPDKVRFLAEDGKRQQQEAQQQQEKQLQQQQQQLQQQQQTKPPVDQKSKKAKRNARKKAAKQRRQEIELTGQNLVQNTQMPQVGNQQYQPQQQQQPQRQQRQRRTGGRGGGQQQQQQQQQRGFENVPQQRYLSSYANNNQPGYDQSYYYPIQTLGTDQRQGNQERNYQPMGQVRNRQYERVDRNNTRPGGLSGGRPPGIRASRRPEYTRSSLADEFTEWDDPVVVQRRQRPLRGVRAA